MSNAKTKEFFFEKKSWSQMIQNCLIQREMAKKIFAGDGGSGGFAAVFRSFLINIIKATAIPKLTALTHFLAEFLR